MFIPSYISHVADTFNISTSFSPNSSILRFESMDKEDDDALDQSMNKEDGREPHFFKEN